jgi:hypothetical protein
MSMLLIESSVLVSSQWRAEFEDDYQLLWVSLVSQLSNPDLVDLVKRITGWSSRDGIVKKCR